MSHDLDLKVTSANGEYRAEALSPSNGTISKDGSRPDPESWEFRHRSSDTEFRYHLLDRHGQVLWEHWQESPRPHQLYLSDEGWLVIRVSPTGTETIRVSIVLPDFKIPEGPVVVAQNGMWTTAGVYLAKASLTLFLTYEGDR